MVDIHAEMYVYAEIFSHKSKIYYSITDKLLTPIYNL